VVDCDSKGTDVDCEDLLESTIVVVEPRRELQQVFRQAFAASGYETIAIGEVSAAIDYVRANRSRVCCILICSASLGRAAAIAFNTVSSDVSLQCLPAVIVLARQHERLVTELCVAPHRVIVRMPVTIRSIREAVARLLRVDVGSTAHTE
jgi:serine/threonine-protein kinase